MSFHETDTGAHNPIIQYAWLTSELVAQQPPEAAKKIALGLIAERARLKNGGQILSFPEFNQHPDPLVNILLARVLVQQLMHVQSVGLTPEQIAVLSIETSGGYLATEISHELAVRLNLSRPPRIIRARRSLSPKPPSPAMGDTFFHVEVHPITANGEPRYLYAAMFNPEDLQPVRLLIALDDFRATGDTLRGGVFLGVDLLKHAGVDTGNLVVTPMVGLEKSQQVQIPSITHPDAYIAPVSTALSLRYWADETRGLALIEADGLPPYRMQQASIADFTETV